MAQSEIKCGNSEINTLDSKSTRSRWWLKRLPSEPRIKSQHPAKISSHNFCESGDMFLSICYVTYRDMALSVESLTVSQHLA